MSPLTRRQALSAGLAAPFAAAGLTGPAHAATHPEMSPVPLSRSFAIGDFKVVTLLDGTAVREEPQTIFGLNVLPEEFAQVSEEAFIPADSATFFFTPTLVDTGSEVILFDTGLGQGGLPKALESAGYGVGDVTHVVLTHMHPDHVGGLMTDGAPTFNGADHICGQTEFDYWTQNPNDAVTANVVPIADRFTKIGDGTDVRSGITSMATFGHTPGHLAFMLDSGDQQLLLAGDMTNHYVWSLAHPDWEVTFDADKQAAAETRRRVLGMLASDRIPMVGYHMPFPALGFVETRGQAFHYVPVSYQFMS